MSPTLESLRERVIRTTPRLWCLWAGARPSQLLLIGVVYLLGVGMGLAGDPVATDGPPASGRLSAETLQRIGVGALVLTPVAITVHYANEYADADTDAITDRTPFSGGSGALERTGLDRSILGLAGATNAGAALVVTVLAVARDALVLDAALLAAVIWGLGLAYSLKPLALVRRGVGEVVNATLGGLLLPVYGVMVVATPTAIAWATLVPFTLLVGCNLLATHWPDRHADGAVGKRTLAVRWSPLRIRRAYAILTIAAALVTVSLLAGGFLPRPVAIAHLAPVPFLLWGWHTLTRQRRPTPAVLAMVSLAGATTVGWWIHAL